ncbi:MULTISPECIES: YihY/virulence factor BrkB family protein [Cycloclasticus]|uniref:Ribonuclease BN-like family protein n=1 Tax=Cycloclasticus pugetii TaxID=34068 RepID=A0AB33Z471_9GAMM|nr:MULTISPECIES: YihY/virulence factor BrkB family protein [Cycloclasticus]ATI03573.1 YihY family inner membrane protein [Cycloclasticus sp. PY97N]EPD14060.1 ribonuclease BN-like family protein [Cycloclasticus pugetii]SHJ02950.1 tRNA-processing RNAse BN [Cycloclasticus pugetii]
MQKNKFNLQDKVTSLLWPDETGLSPFHLLLLKILRVVYVSVTDLMEGQLSLRAMSLVYTTLLSIVPLLALSFSVLKAMGVHNEIEPFLFQFLAPLGEQGTQIGENIIGFIDNIKVGVLGSVGLGLLIYTVLSLVQKIENAFNMIWHVETTRSIGERFSSYLSVILIGPVMMVSAIGVTATIMSSSIVTYFATIEPFGSLIVLATKLLPYLMVMGAFTFIYMFVPNTRVRLSAALIGAIVAGFLWESSGLLFATFVVNSTKYTAIYSSFAVVIMLLIWLYISWLILLFGSNLAFYVQNPSSLRVDRGGFEISNRVKERIALLLMQLIGEKHYAGEKPPTMADLTGDISAPHTVVRYVLKKLIAQHLVIGTNETPVAYLPAKSLDVLLLSDVIQAVRCAEEDHFLAANVLTLKSQSLELVNGIDKAISASLGNKTVRDLVVDSKQQ